MGIVNPRPAMRRREARMIMKRLRAQSILHAKYLREMPGNSHEQNGHLAMKKVLQLTEKELDGFIKGNDSIQ